MGAPLDVRAAVPAKSVFGNVGGVRIGGVRSGEKGPGFALPTRGGSQSGCAGFFLWTMFLGTSQAFGEEASRSSPSVFYLDVERGNAAG